MTLMPRFLEVGATVRPDGRINASCQYVEGHGYHDEREMLLGLKKWVPGHDLDTTLAITYDDGKTWKTIVGGLEAATEAKDQ